MKTTLVFVRHGESQDNAAGRFGGRRDVGLTAIGQRQARDSAERLSKTRLDLIVSSPLQRARITADYIAAAQDLSVIVEKGLEEADFGEWEGMTFTEVREVFPEKFREWMHAPLTTAPPAGESFEDLCRRVHPVIDRLVRENRGKHLAIVAHGGTIRAALILLLGVPLGFAQHVTIDPGSVTIIDDFNGHGVIRSMNCSNS